MSTADPKELRPSGRRNVALPVLALVGLAVLGAGIAFLSLRPGPAPVERSRGFDDPATPPQAGNPARVVPQAQTPAPAVPAGQDPVRPALDAYNKGRFAEAEREAQEVLTTQAAARATPTEQSAKARWVLAFARARQRDLRGAREQFAQLKNEAATLPDGGKLPGERKWEERPSLEEEAAYQHAVLTAALGDKAGAEAELMAFMRQYPESRLLHAAVLRLERLHNGTLPPEAEKARQAAMAIQRQRDEREGRERASCGPECLVELLHRRTPAAAGADDPEARAREIRELATEMGTTNLGTTMAALGKAAEKRGFHPQGWEFTWNGLQKAKLPLIALLARGHFVVVTEVRNASLEVWDPQLGGEGKPGTRRYTREEWERDWQGITLTLE